MGVFMCLLNTEDEWIKQARGLLIAQRRRSWEKKQNFTRLTYLPGFPDQGSYGAARHTCLRRHVEMRSVS